MIHKSFFISSYQIGCIILNGSHNLSTIIDVFKKPDNVYLCSYALIRDGVLLKMNVTDFSVTIRGKIH